MLARALVDSGRAEEALSLSSFSNCSTPAEFALLQVAAEAADRLGRPACSAPIYRRLAEARPSDWRLWNALGNALAASKDWQLAIEALIEANKLNPNHPLLLRNLASAYHACGRLDESTRTLESLLANHPKLVEARVALATLSKDAGRPQEACRHFGIAWEQDPRRSEIAIAYARSLVDLSLFEDAESVYRHLLTANPADVVAVHELGLILERTSRIAELGALLQQARSAGVAGEHLGYLAAALAFRSGKAEEAQQLLDLQAPSSEPTRWHRLRAKIADALGSPHQAFISATAMNHSVEDFEKWRRRGSDYRSRLRMLAPTIDSDWCSRILQIPNGERRTPAFIIGFPRSGTTLLDTFLMGHPNVHVLEELHMLGAAELVIGQLAELPNIPAETLVEARAAYFEHLDYHVPEDFSGLVVDKLPLNILGTPLIHALFPDARLICSLRHPCDAVLSGFMQSFELNDAMACFLDLEDAADLYDAVMDIWQRTRSNLPLTVHELRYEELVAEPEQSLRALLDFLGLDWTDRILDHRATAAARGAVATASYDQITQPLTSRPIGRWHAFQREMAPVLPTLLKWAKTFNYSH